MANYVDSYINEDPEAASVWDVVSKFYDCDCESEVQNGFHPSRVLTEHINHIRTVAGVDHVGIGSDFCGAPMPFGLEDSSTYPILIAALIEDDTFEWTDEELGKLASGNLIRWEQFGSLYLNENARL